MSLYFLAQQTLPIEAFLKPHKMLKVMCPNCLRIALQWYALNVAFKASPLLYIGKGKALQNGVIDIFPKPLSVLNLLNGLPPCSQLISGANIDESYKKYNARWPNRRHTAIDDKTDAKFFLK